MSQCPLGTQEAAGLCVDCPRHCVSCEAEGCHVCEAGTVLAGRQCSVRCGPGYFRQNSSHCSPCHPSCHSCVGPGDTDYALSEAPSLYFSRRCVPYCPTGWYLLSMEKNMLEHQVVETVGRKDTKE